MTPDPKDPEDVPVVIGVDLAWSHDATAIVPLVDERGDTATLWYPRFRDWLARADFAGLETFEPAPWQRRILEAFLFPPGSVNDLARRVRDCAWWGCDDRGGRVVATAAAPCERQPRVFGLRVVADERMPRGQFGLVDGARPTAIVVDELRAGVTAPAPPRRGTGTQLVYECQDDDEDDGRCHVLEPTTHLPLCGKRIRRSSGRSPGAGVHVTRDPRSDPCDGCGAPRCGACALLAR